MRLTPAEHVIREFGSRIIVAKATKLRTSTVWRWTAPKSKTGTGGLIPVTAQKKVLIAARRRNLDITAEDIIFGREVKTRK